MDEIQMVTPLRVKTFDVYGVGKVGLISRNDEHIYLAIGDQKIDRFQMLALAADSTDELFAWKLLNLASMMFHATNDWAFNSLYKAVAMDITHSFMTNEFACHSLFAENASRLFGSGTKVIKKRGDKKHQPDSWISIDGEEIPVEIKKGKFGAKALRQIQRHVDFYGTKRGIAVGARLTVELPENIIFVSLSQLEPNGVNGGLAN